MAQRLLLTLGSVLALATSTRAQFVPRTRGDGEILVHSDAVQTVSYTWDYVHDDVDPYVDFHVVLEATIDRSSDELTGIALGVVSSEVSADYGSVTDADLMKATRNAHIIFENSGSGIVGSVFAMVPETCSTDSECNAVNWGSTQNSIRDNYRASIDSSTCTDNGRLQVMEITHSQANGIVNADIGLRMYADAFQTCGNNDERFEISMEPGNSIKLVYALWLEAERTAPVAFRRPHTHVWARGDPIEISLTQYPPTPSPTNAPTARPTTPQPTNAPTPPTRSPTPAPTKLLRCPNSRLWIECDRVNDMFRHLQNRPMLRKAKIKHVCNNRRFRSKCTFCGEHADSFSACRPKKANNGRRYAKADVCAGEVAPFEGLGCEKFQCPSPMLMDACRAVNDLDIPGTPRNKRPVCINAFDYDGFTVRKGQCHWCAGRCKPVGQYTYSIAKAIICENDDFFANNYGCEYASGSGAAGITSPHYTPGTIGN
ncbi:Hypothetical Protein FCC1311_063062 [Hondaea fermentalgiana]|uniref:Uncharacterized protein n=1 Tax=Hondaea fermentalgiana TaxID=2315210 RepID=A0A2R5GGQ3_9STRA|nr:Hypothetical Protein FCC1311_063062 [Hondaea fermentalgiana]|eukprot:GBG30086.1 Hypothetical Protein FCC1311_063062 [Hondaea fermentalgiana]